MRYARNLGLIMKKNANEFIRDADAWDNRELGASIEHVEVASDEEMAAFNDALSLQAISIRLQKKLIADLKSIADNYNVGYQPMIRDLLQRFVIAEKKQMLQIELNKITEEESKQEDSQAIDSFIELIRKEA